MVIKNPPAMQEMQETMSSVFGLGRSPEGGHVNPLQYSCLENTMDRGAWPALVYRVAWSWTRLKRLSMHTGAHTGNVDGMAEKTSFQRQL